MKTKFFALKYVVMKLNFKQVKRVNDIVPHCVHVYLSEHSYVNSEEDEINDTSD